MKRKQGIKTKKLVIKIVSVFVVLFISFITADYISPLPNPQHKFSTVVLAEDKTPLRAFPDKNGVWRYPVKAADVSPKYIQALMGYEDRWFYYHPGVNPLALCRAFAQMIKYGKPISGGSTITMQVARLLDPHSKDLPGKLKQMFRALQLEWHYSKAEILDIYLNIAPFGGPIEGVQAASYTYLGKSAQQLTYAEAALLAVLPQSPTRFRPDRHPKRARKARDKVLKRLDHFNIWPKNEISDAFAEDIPMQNNSRPQIAAILAYRLLKTKGSHTDKIQTTIDFNLQISLEDQVKTYISQMPVKTSAAVLVVENKTMKARAYVGSADYKDSSRFGYIDMIKSMRSPGSTLKPFLYGLAIDDGLIHSASLLQDVPISYDGYRPQNFLGGYYGAVTVSSALQKSLNIPAVQVLKHYGENRFVDNLRNSGLTLKIPGNGKPNLAVILGGVATNLEDLVGTYSSLSNQGLAGNIIYTQSENTSFRRILSPESAWVIKKILEENQRPGINDSVLFRSNSRKVAWKTGTSYGHRDSWAIGVTDQYTIGVWVGRPDSTPQPGQYGAVSAAPLLFDIVDGYNLSSYWNNENKTPVGVSESTICWPLGMAKTGPNDPYCHVEHKAWILNGATPTTLREKTDKITTNTASILLDEKSGKRVNLECSKGDTLQTKLAIWPTRVLPWLDSETRIKATPPKPAVNCKNLQPLFDSKIKITGISDHAIIKRVPNSKDNPTISLNVIGAETDVYWLKDQKLIRKLSPNQNLLYKFNIEGEHNFFVIDEAGNMDKVSIIFKM